ncbi:MAG: hypothetical protein RIB67_03570 [Miltoncostaeaceae bacterium]
MRRTGMVAALVAAALAVAGCGGGGDGGSEGADMDTGPTPASEAPSTGTPADPPAVVRACLEADGMTVREVAAEDEGATDRLMAEDARGAATVIWFVHEGYAFDAHSAALETQKPDSVVGRKSEAVYVVELLAPDDEGLSELGRTVVRCV